MKKKLLPILLCILAIICIILSANTFIRSVRKQASKCHPELDIVTSIARKVNPSGVQDQNSDFESIEDFYENGIISKMEYEHLVLNNAVYYPHGMMSRYGHFFLACRYDNKRTWIMALTNGGIVTEWNPLAESKDVNEGVVSDLSLNPDDN